MITLAGLVAMGPKECVMGFSPPFRLKGSEIKNRSSASQILEILSSLSTRNGGDSH